MTVRTVQTPDLSPIDRTRLRRLLNAAFAGDFSDFDWDYASGGWHVVAVDAGELVAHAAVVPRRLVVTARVFNAGYAEAVAVMPSRQRQGLGSIVMRHANEIVHREFEFGALSTGMRVLRTHRMGMLARTVVGPAAGRAARPHARRGRGTDDFSLRSVS